MDKIKKLLIVKTAPQKILEMQFFTKYSNTTHFHSWITYYKHGNITQLLHKNHKYISLSNKKLLNINITKKSKLSMKKHKFKKTVLIKLLI